MIQTSITCGEEGHKTWEVIKTESVNAFLAGSGGKWNEGMNLEKLGK